MGKEEKDLDKHSDFQQQQQQQHDNLLQMNQQNMTFPQQHQNNNLVNNNSNPMFFTQFNKPNHLNPHLQQQHQQQQQISQFTDLKELNLDLNIKYEFLKYPPSNQVQYRSVVLDYIISDLFTFPIHEKQLCQNINNQFLKSYKHLQYIFDDLQISPILQELMEKEALTLEKYCVGVNLYDFVVAINREKLKQLSREFSKDRPKSIPLPQQAPQFKIPGMENLHQRQPQQLQHNLPFNLPQNSQLQQQQNTTQQNEIDSLLQTKIGYQKVIFEQSEEIQNLVNKLSASEDSALQKFKKSQQKIEFCDFGTKEKCRQFSRPNSLCFKTHFKRIIQPHTDESLGNCSYLDTCRHLDFCKFVHYEIESNDIKQAKKSEDIIQHQDQKKDVLPHENEVQWVECDLRNIDFSVLGKFDVIMADPPWDIHMNLPYETMKDKEMKNLRFDLLQDDGVLFLWVTGRAMELGRECMQIWGYKRVEELIWIKTNQLQRIIRTGRTGHWLNHSKEHCLVGIKGNPKINKNVDCDVIVSEVRETSRKPDEIYHLLNRMSPKGRKIELFGRPHNCMKGWMTLGNQLPGVYICEPDILENYKNKYPDVDCSHDQMQKNLEKYQSEQVNDKIYNSHIQTANPPFKTK